MSVEDVVLFLDSGACGVRYRHVVPQRSSENYWFGEDILTLRHKRLSTVPLGTTCALVATN